MSKVVLELEGINRQLIGTIELDGNAAVPRKGEIIIAPEFGTPGQDSFLVDQVRYTLHGKTLTAEVLAYSLSLEDEQRHKENRPSENMEDQKGGWLDI